ncbi:uncharacterized protein LOC141793487 [Halichoeres trimaculatus]|uniref:uncharacterized protein LOC141793487 n=1 Tax=Halichoeres trimaculatus TaxID=147232 RepID=UPI003D9EF7CB
MHVSIFTEVRPKVKCCTTCCKQYHCPICPKLKSFPFPKFERHLDVHVKNAIAFKDVFLCRCSLQCRDVGHFHCPLCGRTVIRRVDMEVHLKLCSPSSCLPTSAKPIQVIPSPYFSAASLASSSSTAAPAPVAPSLSLKKEPSPVAISPSPKAASAPLASSLSPVAAPLASSPPPKAAPVPVAPSFSLVSPPSPPSTTLLPQVTSTLVIPEPQDMITPKVRPKMVKCPHCSLILHQKNVPKHIQRKHTEQKKDVTAQDHLKSVCVDATNGIYAVKKTKHGFSVPVHAQNKTWGHVHKVECELEECRQSHLTAVRSGLLSKHCEHIRSLQYCTDITQEECLQEETLTALVKLQLFGEAKKANCLKRQSHAQATHVPLCVQVNLQETQGRFCFSVHEPKLNHYNRLGRLMVTYNQTENTWRCLCVKPRVPCVHKNISQWHLFQLDPSIFKTEAASPSTPEEPPGSAYPPSEQQVKQLVQYLYSHKRLPETIPEDLTKPRAVTDFLTELHPKETTCAVCPGSVQLGHSSNITQEGKIITMNGIIENVSTYYKCCPHCKMVFRYQEWTDGLHNFNDHVMLSLEMCVFLRHSLQNRVSVSEVISSLECLRDVTFPLRDTILHAYCHFEALTGHDYSVSCVRCGYHPPGVVMDLHKKGVFNLSMGDTEEASGDNCGKVVFENFWDLVQQEMIARGFSPTHPSDGTESPLERHSD